MKTGYEVSYSTSPRFFMWERGRGRAGVIHRKTDVRNAAVRKYK